MRDAAEDASQEKEVAFWRESREGWRKAVRVLNAGRRQRIVDYVEKMDGATVGSLAETFGVSVATIRRDLALLDREGLVERAHGGAAPRSRGRIPGLPEAPVLSRSTLQVKEKRAIAKAAVRYVEDGDVVFISGGSTTAEMIPHLAHLQSLSVITNALNVASLLAAQPQINAIIVGGTLRHSEMSMLGALTEDALRSLRADKLFMGCPAVHQEHGFSADDMTEVQSDRAIMTVANEISVLADHTKFGRIATMRQAPITGVQRLITDPRAPAYMVESIREQGVEVDIATLKG